jgi:magnesium-transporting ATPase (P-type)
LVVPEEHRLFRIVRAVCLANEASLTRRLGDGMTWEWSGDPTDVALLALGIKAGVDRVALIENHAPVESIPFEPERRYAASYHRMDGGGLVCVKGAPERVLDMCDRELATGDRGPVPLDREAAAAAVEDLMRQGYRVLAVADAETPLPLTSGTLPPEPSRLVFLGVVAMTDPPRDRVEASLARCREAGIRVVMVTGDHATTGGRTGHPHRQAPGRGGLPEHRRLRGRHR